MKTALKWIRFPLDFMYLTIDCVRCLPEFVTRLIKRRSPCSFCEVNRIDQSTPHRACPAADRYAQHWMFQLACPCAFAGNEDFPTGHCSRNDRYSRFIWHLPITGLLVATGWLALALVIAQCAGYPALEKLAKQLHLRQTPAQVVPPPTVQGNNNSESHSETRSAFDLAMSAMDKGQQAMDRGDIATARICFLNARKHYPKNAEAHFMLGQCYLRAGQLSLARTSLEEAARLDSNLPDVHLYLAETFAHQSLNDQALEHALIHRKQQPNDSRATIYCMRLYDELLQPELAQDMALEISRSSSTNLSDLAEVGAFFLRNNELESADYLFEEILKVEDDHLAGLIGKARIHLKNGDYAAAQKLLERTKQRGGEPIQIAMLESLLHRVQGNRTAATAVYEKLMDQIPASPALAIEFATHLFSDGDLARAQQIAEAVEQTGQPRVKHRANILLVQLSLKQNQAANAQQRCEEILAHYPDDLAVRLLLARAAIQQKKLDEAEQVLRGILDADPGHIPARNTLARILVGTQRYDDAISEMETLARLYPKDARPLISLAQHFYFQEDLPRTIQSAEQALLRNPDATVAANRLVIALVDSGSLKKAREVITPFVRSHPDQPFIQQADGWLAFAEGHLEHAVDQLELAALKIQGPVLHYHLGSCYAKTGETAKARHHLSEAVRFPSGFPGKDQARSLLSDLP